MPAPSRTLAALAAATALLAGACDRPAPEPAWPEGCVLGVSLGADRVPILAAEVDRWLDAIELLERHTTRPAQRRYALTNLVLYPAVAHLIDPESNAAARAAAEAARTALVAGEPAPEGVELTRIDGSFDDVGLDTWARARELEPGEWSEVFESPGAYVVFRLVLRPEGDGHEVWHGRTRLVIERALFPYVEQLDSKTLIESALDQCTLHIVDPAWEEIVPAHYLYRMQ